MLVRDGDELPHAAGGLQVAPHDLPHVRRIVEELSTFVAIPVPHLWVLDDPVPQAMATGSSPDQAAVTVSSGLLQLLDRRELRAVLAHEVGHVRLGHVATSTAFAARLARRDGLVSAAGFGAGWLAGTLTDAVSETVAGSVAGMAVGMVSGRRSRRQFAIHSRTSENEADMFAGEVGGSPAALASALQKIQVAVIRQSTGMDEWRRAISIVEPEDAFATHPPTVERRRVLAGVDPGRMERSCVSCWFPEDATVPVCRRCGTPMEAEVCGNCESPVDAADSACGSCGAVRTVSACWWCDQQLVAGDQFCRACGGVQAMLNIGGGG